MKEPNWPDPPDWPENPPVGPENPPDWWSDEEDELGLILFLSPVKVSLLSLTPIGFIYARLVDRLKEWAINYIYIIASWSAISIFVMTDIIEGFQRILTVINIGLTTVAIISIISLMQDAAEKQNMAIFGRKGFEAS